MFCRLQ